MKKEETSEKVFERELSKFVEESGGMAVKLLSQFIKGLPDRMFLLPGGVVIFVEFKSTGKRPTKIQSYIHAKIRARGFDVYVVDSVETFEIAKDYINEITLLRYGR